MSNEFLAAFEQSHLEQCGIMVVTDSSLGNTNKDGGDQGGVLEKIYSTVLPMSWSLTATYWPGEKGAFVLWIHGVTA